MANKFNMKGLEGKVKKNLSNALVIIANEAKNHFVKSFRDGGFTDNTLVKWKPRKSKSKRDIGRAILVKTGDLRRSVKIKGINKSSLNIIIGSDLPYAKVHNDGLSPMPKRKFIGNSNKLNKKIIVIIDKRIKSIFK